MLQKLLFVTLFKRDTSTKSMSDGVSVRFSWFKQYVILKTSQNYIQNNTARKYRIVFIKHQHDEKTGRSNLCALRGFYLKTFENLYVEDTNTNKF